MFALVSYANLLRLSMPKSFRGSGYRKRFRAALISVNRIIRPPFSCSANRTKRTI